MTNLDRLLEKSTKMDRCLLNTTAHDLKLWIYFSIKNRPIKDDMLTIAVEALESCIKRIEGDHKSHCWRMDKEYLTEEYVKNDSHLRGLKETLAKIEALAAKALGEGES